MKIIVTGSSGHLGEALMSQTAQFRLGFVPAVAVVALAFWFVPAYVQLYESLAFELPLATSFLFEWYPVLAFLPLLPLVGAWYVSPHPAWRGTLSLCVSVVVSALFVALGWWAVNLPMQPLMPAA
jgi:hypothetical protein